MVLRGSGESDGPPQVHQHGTPKSTLPCPTQAVCMIHRVQRVGRNKDGPEIGVLGTMNGSTAIGSILATGLQQERDGKFGKGRDVNRILLCCISWLCRGEAVLSDQCPGRLPSSEAGSRVSAGTASRPCTPWAGPALWSLTCTI